MSCRNNKRWFVINYENSTVYAYLKNGNLGWVSNLPWVRPYLFQTYKDASDIAQATHTSARYYEGKIYKNSKDDNVLCF